MIFTLIYSYLVTLSQFKPVPIFIEQVDLGPYFLRGFLEIVVKWISIHWFVEKLSIMYPRYASTEHNLQPCTRKSIGKSPPIYIFILKLFLLHELFFARLAANITAAKPSGWWVLFAIFVIFDICSCCCSTPRGLIVVCLDVVSNPSRIV